MLPDPIAVIKDIRQLVLDHKDDNKELAITGKYVLRWNESDDVDHIKKPRKHIPKMASGGAVGEMRKKPDNSNPISTLQPAMDYSPMTTATSPTKVKPSQKVFLSIMNFPSDNIKINKIHDDNFLSHDKELDNLEILFNKIENDN